jgi:hypothetical protein
MVRDTRALGPGWHPFWRVTEEPDKAEGGPPTPAEALFADLDRGRQEIPEDAPDFEGWRVWFRGGTDPGWTLHSPAGVFAYNFVATGLTLAHFAKRLPQYLGEDAAKRCLAHFDPVEIDVLGTRFLVPRGWRAEPVVPPKPNRPAL